MTTDGGQAADRAFDPTTTSIMPSEVVTRVLLLRHGEVENFGKRVVRGQLNVGLSAEGSQQHERLIDWIERNEAQPDYLYTSDLARCSDLAARLEAIWPLKATVTKLLREQCLGRWQGRTWEEVTVEDSALVTAYWDDYAGTVPPEGESMLEMGKRAGAWLDSTIAKNPGTSIVACTHIGVIRALLCRLLGVPASDALRFAPALASSTEVLISEAGAVVTRMGERPWMWGPDRKDSGVKGSAQ
ncbi:MAG: alpha-ribazole phosphatase [Planctomycetota bacterium]|jgi:alpha-ribazole phosphatase